MRSGKPFKTLPISTQTVMAYSNCSFNIRNIERKLEATCIENIPTKKFCGEDGKIYFKKTLKIDFRNQKTYLICVKGKMITLKLFPNGKLHLTGCKTLEHQRSAIITLINAIRKAHSSLEPTFLKADGPIKIILDVVMVNVDFNINFCINQRNLDKLLQNNATDFYTIYESSINNSINIKLDYDEPLNKKYEQITIQGSIEKPKILFSTTDVCNESKTNGRRTHTFLVFTSSKVIFSGRYYDNEMEIAYKKFNKFIIENKKKIEFSEKKASFNFNNIKCIENPIKIEYDANLFKQVVK